MVDDTYYITPHEAALAVVATSMKKARLQLDTLIVNSILGGVLFSAGSVLFVAGHAENMEVFNKNPGLLNFLGGLTFSVGLFYVVMMGVDLFNSNILFYSVGVYRRAVSIYDLLISWFISWLGNIAGSLFVSYLFIDVSGISSHEHWDIGAIRIAEEKASYSFMQTFIKGIAGNFFVCLAIYLQLLAKPVHVKFLLMTLPVFTFVASGYTHVVADMTTFFIGMLCGADVSVGKYIWKVLIPSSLGTIVGGAAFGLVIPFYLHLIVVERDRAKLSLPEFEARDEQPELNMDSRVVRVPVAEQPSSDGEDSDAQGILSEKEFNDGTESLSDQSLVAHSDSAASSQIETPLRFSPSRPRTYTNESNKKNSIHLDALSRINTLKSISNHSKKSNKIRSPPGVFPVKGMGDPLAKERTIENSNFNANLLKQIKSQASTISGYEGSVMDNEVLKRVKTAEYDEERNYLDDAIDKSKFVVPEDKLGARLERAITRIGQHRMRSDTTDDSHMELPRTVQDTFPHNSVSRTSMYDAIDSGDPTVQEEKEFEERRRAAFQKKKRSISSSNLFNTISREMRRSDASGVEDFRKKMQSAGVTTKAVMAADNIAGIAHFSELDLNRRHYGSSPQPLHLHRSYTVSMQDMAKRRAKETFETEKAAEKEAAKLAAENQNQNNNDNESIPTASAESINSTNSSSSSVDYSGPSSSTMTLAKPSNQA